jgi:hypothetical protein
MYFTFCLGEAFDTAFRPCGEGPVAWYLRKRFDRSNLHSHASRLPHPRPVSLPKARHCHGCQIFMLFTPPPGCARHCVRPIYHYWRRGWICVVAASLCRDRGLYVISRSMPFKLRLTVPFLVPQCTSRLRISIILIGAVYTLTAIISLIGSVPPSTRI